MRLPYIQRTLLAGLVVAVIVTANTHRALASPKKQITADASAETRLKLAMTLLYAHRYDEAIAEYEKVVAAEPSNRDARVGLAQALFWSGRPGRALKALEPTMATETDADVTALWNEILAASGNAVEAIKALQASVKAHPDKAEIGRSYANLLASFGCYGPAIKVLRQLTDKFPDSPGIALDLAHAYFTADRYPEAITLAYEYEQEGGLVGRRARIILTRSLMKTRRCAEAAEALNAIRQRDVDEPRAALGLLTIWVLAPEATDIAPQKCMSALTEADNRTRLHELDEVREWLFPLVGELVSHEPSEEHVAIARQLAQLLETDKDDPATRLCRESLIQFADEGPEAVEPNVEPLIAAIAAGDANRSTQLEVCNVLLALYAGEQLVTYCDASLGRDPDDISLELFRAEGLAVIPEYDEAEVAYTKVLDELPQCTKARRGLARTYSWFRQFERAEEVYTDLIERDPTDMIIRREAARSLGWDKQLTDSLDFYEESAEGLGDSPAEKTWADSLLLERQAKRAYWWNYKTEAVEHYKAFLENEPADLEARFDLAQIYAHNRHWEEAAEQYNKILDIDARHRRARDALYKNAIYHRPELRTEYQWTKEQGRGDLLDMETCRLTETLKQEIALRTDLSIINTQMWHRFDKFVRDTFDEYHLIARLDHRFNLKTWGHISSGLATLDGTHDENRWIGDFALSHEATDWLTVTLGGKREPWRRNWVTMKQGLDEERLFVRLAFDIDPWFDWFVEYGRSWIENGCWWRTPEDDIVTRRNALNEMLWGANYRFSLFPKILQFEYRGWGWWFTREVPTYFSPDPFFINNFRLAWRHYLNTDQYFEQKQLYYELAMTGSIDSDGVGGIGYDAALGWDLCHHFGVEAKWSQFCSSVYTSRMFYLSLVARF